MLNARSVDRQHAIGSQVAYGYDQVVSNYYNWSRLEAFAKRFAAPGAEIKIYCLPYQEDSKKNTCFLMKMLNTPF